MNTDQTPIEHSLQADIDALRTKYHGTQDLYREACAVMFFRYGITPTANKLYQLVRKGSMSAPAEALAKFWSTLREKAKLRIEHPDVPQPLLDIAGELTGKLWELSRRQADEATDAVRAEAAAQIEEARQAAQLAAEQETRTRLELAEQNALIETLQAQISELQQDVAREGGLREGLERQVEQIQAQRQELVTLLDASRQSEHRAVDEQRRLMLEIDRERAQSARHLKDVDALRASMASAATKHSQELEAAHREAEAIRHRTTSEIDTLRQRDTELRMELAAARSQLEQLQRSQQEHKTHGTMKPLRTIRPSKPPIKLFKR